MLLLLLACRAPALLDTSTAYDTDGVDTDAGEAPSQCAAPAASVAYADQADAWGLIDTTDDDPVRQEDGALALVDVDSDGDDDLILAPRGSGVRLQRNLGGRFGDEPLSPDPALAIAPVDLDGDGDLDLILAGRGPQRALENDGDGVFTDVTAAWGLELALPGIRRHAVTGDLDGDGDLDLYFTIAGAPDRLFRHDGDRFTDVSDWLPETPDSGLGWSTVLSDLDEDGDLDLYTVNADQTMWGDSRLLRNDGLDGARLVLTDVSADCGCARTGNSMGASAGDYDNDGDADLFVTNTGAARLLGNLGGLRFADMAQAEGATAVPDLTYMTFGSALYDHDNDGLLDVFTTGGPLHGGESRDQTPVQPDVLLHQGADGFVDVAPGLGMATPAAGRGIAPGLLDGDGFLDLAVFHLGTPSHLWVPPCTADRALIVELSGPAPNPFGVGGRVEVVAGGRAQVREITSNAGWGGAMHPRAHFGLGADAPERITVYWPSGDTQEVALGPDTPLRITIAAP